MDWIYQLPILVFSVVVHEVSHGWAALRRGDRTAEHAGRLTLNPAAHVDPFGTLFLPLLCFFTGSPMFGWARPVPVNEARLQGPRARVAVAAAGPLANVCLALAGALLLRGALWAPLDPDFKGTLAHALLFAVSVNLFLAFFNLLPVYPLDGCGVLRGLLPLRARRAYDKHMPYGAFLILLLVFTRATDALVAGPSRWTLALLGRMGFLG